LNDGVEEERRIGKRLWRSAKWPRWLMPKAFSKPSVVRESVWGKAPVFDI